MRLKPWTWPLAVFAVTLAALLAGLLVVDRWGEAAITRQQTAIGRAAADYFVAFAHDEGTDAVAAALNRHARLDSADGFRYAMIDAQGRMLGGSDVLGALDVPDKGWTTVIEPDSKPRRMWRVLAQPLGGGRTVIVAEDLTARDALRNAIMLGSLLALGLTALGAAGAGLALHAVLLRRTRAIAHTAERIAEGDLSARAPHEPGGDAFDELARAVNAMLTRIEELMVGMRTVTDSLAHDLRSPLTHLQGALARASEPGLPESRRLGEIEHAQAELARVLATLSALLDIAQAETGLSRDMMRRVDIAGLALEMGDLFAPVAEDAGQSLAVDAPPTPLLALAHETLLRQAVGNLLHNALIHAGADAAVRLTVVEGAHGMVTLTVDDTGPGVPDSQLGRVLERFVRLEPARTTAGSGLGLALVAACAKLHGGRLMLEDNAPGLRAVLELPAAA